jgi:GxxExxY protein
MFLYKEESYQLIGLCMEVHRVLGRGLLEVLYKDALEHEFRLNKIPFIREKQFEVKYKGATLPHFFFADFVVFENIILEVKGLGAIVDEHIKQTLNYMAIAKAKVGYIVNFGGESLEYKRLIL